MKTQTPSIGGLRRLSYLIIPLFAGPFILLDQERLVCAQVPSSPIISSGLNTVVSDSIRLPGGQIQYNITGGTRPNSGTNLFHSFGEFGVPTNNIANFLNETVLPTSNILARVTNGNPSLLLGTIQTEGFGSANLFLMNPAGIVFGSTAQLNVGGSVHFTTADYLRLTDNALFHATIKAGADALLTAAPVAAFGFLGQTPSAITVQGSSLAVPIVVEAETSLTTGSTISLVGGDINIVADPTTGTPATLTASSGRINLVSVASPGEVLFPSMQTGPNMNGRSFAAMGTVRLEGGSALDVSGSFSEGDGHAGSIYIRGGQFVMDASVIVADTLGDVNASNPSIVIAMDGDVTLQNGSFALSDSLGSGYAGNVEIAGRIIQVLDGSLVQTSSVADGSTAQAGDIALHATESILVSGSDPFGNPSTVSSIVLGIDSGHNSGQVNLEAPSVTISDLGLIQTLTQTNGRAGAIRIAADNLHIQNGGAIESSSSSPGSTGMITLVAQDTVTVAGTFGGNTPSRISHLNTGTGLVNEGGISIETAKFALLDGALIQNITTVSNGSTTTLAATDSVRIVNQGSIMVVGGSLNEGSLSITSPTIVLSRSEIKGRTFAGRDAGAMTLKSTSGDIVLSDSSRILTSTENSSGDAGSLSLEAAGSVVISGASTLESSSVNSSNGNGGIIRVQAGHSLSLADQGTGILSVADSSSSANGGAISIQASQVLFQSNAQVSASSTGVGNAGSITINAASDFQSNGGTIRSTASHGLGGDITISAGQDIRLTNGASVSASSTGPGNAGNSTALAGDDFVMQDSSMTTQATQASGGNIKIGAQDQIVLQNSLLSASVMGGGGGGGNISIDPIVVILQNSQILAQAILGNGGNISIITPLFLADQTSLVSASSQFGLSGTVNIQSPTSNLAGTVSSLPSSLRQVQSLQTGRCAALADSQSSSLIVAGRDNLPAEPGGWSPSPFALLDEETDSLAMASPPVAAVTASADAPVSLRRLTPAGFLTQSFAENGLTGCRA